MGRNAYIVGEKIPLAIRAAGDEVKLEAIDEAGRRLLLHRGRPEALVLDTRRLASGRYALHLNGADTGAAFTLTSPIRKSSGALTDESLPGRPRISRQARRDPAKRRAILSAWREQVTKTLKESGIDAAFAMCAAEMGRNDILDPLTEAGTMLFVNPYTRPMSFNPVRIYKPELAAFRQRLALMAQVNGRYPSFGGFCFAFDPVGHLNRKMLLFYWGWGKQDEALRRYIARSDKAVCDEFTRRTGMKPVRTDEYVTYLLSIGRPEFAPAIDLPTARWLEEMARHLKPVGKQRLAELEKRIDAWSSYLMGIYEETYKGHRDLLRDIAPWMCHTSSVNIDHCTVKDGQYTPSAYRPLDFRYITAWNDQIAGPDYAYQWLLSAAMLNTNRRGERIWVAHSLGMVHGQAGYPGKFVRAIAHNLAHGGSGAGFALEGFSTVLGGMNRQTHWENMKGKAIAEGLRAGRDFLDRFAFLAVACKGDHGVGILYSRSQMARQHLAQGLGTPQYKALVTLTRLGYTPRFVTEEEIVERGITGVKALMVVGQTFPLPSRVVAGIEAFVRKGRRVLADGSTRLKLPGAEPLGITLGFQKSGKPHNWACPNLPQGTRHIDLVERWHRELAPAVLRTLGDTGRAWLTPQKGAQSRISVMQIHGGRDAKYLVCVNDSSIKSHTDWFQIRETLLPGKAVPADSVGYDLNDERALGKVAPVTCDLTMTTGRVYAVLRRPLAGIAVNAPPSVVTGQEIAIAVLFEDREGRDFEAALPFELRILRPDGAAALNVLRSTTRGGKFRLPFLMPGNAAAGEWRVGVRSLLTGEVAEVGFTVRPAGELPPLAAPLRQSVIVRNGEALRSLLGGKAPHVVLPLFDSPHVARLAPLARHASRRLAQKGVRVTVRQKPEMTTYWLAYEPTQEQLAENTRADRAETFGRIKVTTVNRNDYFATLGGYAFGEHVLLLDRVGADDNPLAEHLAKVGALWPDASRAFPGPGRAVVHVVQRAFHPEKSAIIVQAADEDGLAAGISALTDPPEDWVGASVATARRALLGGFHIGGRPRQARPTAVAPRKPKVRRAPQPFTIHFLDTKPVTLEPVQPPPAAAHEPTAVPATVDAEHFIPQLRTEAGYTDAWTPGGKWKADLRFADAILLVVDVKKPGRTTIVAEGTFRYCDRRPRSQSTWEDILALRDKIVPKKRRPMAFNVVLDGKPIGRLEKLATAARQVPVETLPFYAKQKPRSVNEEVATRVRGQVDLPAGQHRLLLIPRNIVDGRLERLHIGVEPPTPEPIKK